MNTRTESSNNAISALLLAAACGLALASAGCGSDDNAAAGDNPDEGDRAAVGPAYLVASRVSSPEGRTV